MVITAQREVDAAYAAAQCVVRTHERLVEFMRVGQTLAEIDRFVAETLDDMDCKSAFLRYRMKGLPPFPSHACVSLHDCIVHGTHDMTEVPIAQGDILKVDIGVIHDGWIGDAAWTYAFGEVPERSMQLMRCGRESLKRGIAALLAGRPLVEWARTVQQYVEKECGFHLIRGLGGHGYGRKLHGPPFVSNVVPRHPGEWPDAWKNLPSGQLLALEPMISLGTPEITSQSGRWPIYTADGSLAVHYEANILVTEDGPRDLTEGLDELPDVVG